MTKSRDDQSVHDPGRRRFLKGVGIAGAGAAIADHLWTEAEAEEKEATPESLSGNVKVVLDECSLHGVGIFRSAQSFDRRDLLVSRIDREHQA